MFAVQYTLIKNPAQASKISETVKLMPILPGSTTKQVNPCLPEADGNRQSMFCCGGLGGQQLKKYLKADRTQSSQTWSSANNILPTSPKLSVRTATVLLFYTQQFLGSRSKLPAHKLVTRSSCSIWGYLFPLPASPEGLRSWAELSSDPPSHLVEFHL